MTKFRLYYDKDKEAEFLNDMAGKGYAMTGFFAGFYSFDRCQPGKYIYQVDITEGLWRVNSDYREFMREMDVEIVCLWGPWVILRKEAAEGPFVLYTDVESNIAQYTKIKMMFKACAIVEIVVLFLELLAALNGVALAWGFCFLLGAIAIAFIREVMRVNGILAELKGRTGDFGEGTAGKRPGRFSGVLALGFLLNAIALLMPEEGSYGQYEFLFGFLKGLLQGCALMFMVIGCVFTLWKRER